MYSFNYRLNKFPPSWSISTIVNYASTTVPVRYALRISRYGMLKKYKALSHAANNLQFEKE